MRLVRPIWRIRYSRPCASRKPPLVLAPIAVEDHHVALPSQRVPHRLSDGARHAPVVRADKTVGQFLAGGLPHEHDNGNTCIAQLLQSRVQRRLMGGGDQ